MLCFISHTAHRAHGPTPCVRFFALLLCDQSINHQSKHSQSCHTLDTGHGRDTEKPNPSTAHNHKGSKPCTLRRRACNSCGKPKNTSQHIPALSHGIASSTGRAAYQLYCLSAKIVQSVSGSLLYLTILYLTDSTNPARHLEAMQASRGLDKVITNSSSKGRDLGCENGGQPAERTAQPAR